MRRGSVEGAMVEPISSRLGRRSATQECDSRSCTPFEIVRPEVNCHPTTEHYFRRSRSGFEFGEVDDTTISGQQ